MKCLALLFLYKIRMPPGRKKLIQYSEYSRTLFVLTDEIKYAEMYDCVLCCAIALITLDTHTHHFYGKKICQNK